MVCWYLSLLCFYVLLVYVCMSMDDMSITVVCWLDFDALFVLYEINNSCLDVCAGKSNDVMMCVICFSPHDGDS